MRTQDITHETDIMDMETYLAWYLRGNRSELPTLEKLEIDYICYLLDMTGDDHAAVADILCLLTKNLTRRLHEYALWL
ncbi:MAG: hypothetical protein KAX11_08275 [Candidatus Aminicenantes bacterium]|nr:hypothetical protein [Candidatus Aminicenantes bacterium]